MNKNLFGRVMLFTCNWKYSRRQKYDMIITLSEVVELSTVFLYAFGIFFYNYIFNKMSFQMKNKR